MSSRIALSAEQEKQVSKQLKTSQQEDADVIIAYTKGVW